MGLAMRWTPPQADAMGLAMHDVRLAMHELKAGLADCIGCRRSH
jgi:hypothetical protein